MAGRRELGFPKTTASSLKEQLARTTLNTVRAQGHPYVEIREDGKSKKEIQLGVLDDKKARLLECHNNYNNLAIVKYGGNLELNDYGHYGLDGVQGDSEVGLHTKDGNWGICDKVIPGVFHKDEIADLRVRFVGLGKIAARILKKDEDSIGISRLWCEWLGKKVPVDEDTDKIPHHDFAIVTFVYTYDLGRKGHFDDVKSLLSSSAAEEFEGEGTGRKRKKSFSDPEDVSESLSDQYNSAGEVSSATNSSTSRLLLARYDDQLLDTRFISSKSVRRELRRQQRIAAERMCDICQQKILRNKDVAALMNMKTGKLACSSRNVNGIFHVFHVSCLIHWILLCEFEIMINQPVTPKGKRKSRRKNGGKRNEEGKHQEIISTNQICSVLCPVCQGTSVHMKENELEDVTITLSQMFRYKIKVSDAHRAWMKNPEKLQNCSTGFHFPPQSEEKFQEKVSPLKLLRFYSADEE